MTKARCYIYVNMRKSRLSMYDTINETRWSIYGTMGETKNCIYGKKLGEGPGAKFVWDKMIKQTSCVTADDHFMTWRVRRGDQFITLWMQPGNHIIIISIYWKQKWVQALYLRQYDWNQMLHLWHNEWAQVLHLWHNEWDQMLHLWTMSETRCFINEQWVRPDASFISAMSQTRKTLTKIMRVTRYWMYDPFITLWVRGDDALIAFCIRPYAPFMTQLVSTCTQFMTSCMGPVDPLMRPSVRTKLIFLFYILSDTRFSIYWKHEWD